MDDNKLRQLERQYKLRVKTGCETCRIRRVKCDETKPECTRCTRTGRKCEGYKHASKARSPAAAAHYRNPFFLVVPQKPSPASIPRNPSRSISPDAAENRSFSYFQTHTLPRWTEFFDSELWSQKVLQLSHTEPAIKHGLLALSAMHERFENTTPIFSTSPKDFAFVQYMQAVKHSNNLLNAHRADKVDLEKVLIACIIFTCYENLAGNYRAANMHLGNGLRILRQYRRDAPAHEQSTPEQESIAEVLFRFDLQAMTFSDNASPYDYNFHSAPELPEIPQTYKKNTHARNDLVALIRCMMWISGVANISPQAPENPTWLQIYARLLTSFDAWDEVFVRYQQNIPPHEQGDPKVYAGNTLLKIYSIVSRTIISAGSGRRTALSWDSFVDNFKTIVDLAETLPILNSAKSATSSRSSTSPSSSSVDLAQPPPATKHRPIAPNPATDTTPPSSGGASIFLFPSDPNPQSRATTPCEYITAPASKKRPSSFSPSFELSPIVPLFIVAIRCRDPITRRRAIALLLNCRRREGVWDSFGTGMVALQCVKLEEGINETVDLGPENWLPLSRKCKEASNIPEQKRVADVFVTVNMPERQVAVNYLLRSGENIDRYVSF